MLDEGIDVGDASRLQNLLATGVFSTVGDIFRNGPAKEVGILQDDAQRLTQGVLVNQLDVDAVISNRT